MAHYLLDTHVLLWSLATPERLHTYERDTIRDPENQILVSAASIWEMAIKKALGKLNIPSDLEDQFILNRFDVLPIGLAHAQGVADLPHIHRDPFDRMLVSQATIERLTLITRDPFIPRYDVSCLTG